MTIHEKLRQAHADLEASYERGRAANSALMTAHVEYEAKYGCLPSITSPAPAEDPAMAKIVEARREIRRIRDEQASIKAHIWETERTLSALDPLDVQIDEKYQEIASLKASGPSELLEKASVELHGLQRQRAEDIKRNFELRWGLPRSGVSDAFETAKQLLKDHERSPSNVIEAYFVTNYFDPKRSLRLELGLRGPGTGTGGVGINLEINCSTPEEALAAFLQPFDPWQVEYVRRPDQDSGLAHQGGQARAGVRATRGRAEVADRLGRRRAEPMSPYRTAGYVQDDVCPEPYLRWCSFAKTAWPRNQYHSPDHCRGSRSFSTSQLCRARGITRGREPRVGSLARYWNFLCGADLARPPYVDGYRQPWCRSTSLWEPV